MATPNILTRMLNDFPTLLPTPSFFTPPSTTPASPTFCSPLHHYHGYLPILSTQHRIDIQLRFPPATSPPPLHTPRPSLFLSVDGPLYSLLSPSAPTVYQRWLQSADIHAFLLDLKDVITHTLSSSSSPSSPSPSLSASLPPTFYPAVVAQLAELGWQHVDSVDDDLRSLHLHAQDTDGRTHPLTLTLPPSFPASPPTFTVDLPVPFPYPWPSSPSLRSLHSAFTSQLSVLSPYFAALSSLDAACTIIDPQPASLSLPHRRLSISPSLSLLLTLNPLSPHPPTPTFLGPPHLTQPLHALWHRSPLPYLTTSGSMLQRVEAVLGVTLQRREVEVEGEGEGGEGGKDGEGVGGGAGCAICYEVRGDDGELLSVQCGDVRCGRRYHARCLYAWLSRNVRSSIIFDVCMGSCINCDQPISVPIQR